MTVHPKMLSMFFYGECRFPWLYIYFSSWYFCFAFVYGWWKSV